MLASFYLRPRGRHQYQRLLANFYLSIVPDLHCAIDGMGERQIAWVFNELSLFTPELLSSQA